MSRRRNELVSVCVLSRHAADFEWMEDRGPYWIGATATLRNTVLHMTMTDDDNLVEMTCRVFEVDGESPPAFRVGGASGRHVGLMRDDDQDEIDDAHFHEHARLIRAGHEWGCLRTKLDPMSVVHMMLRVLRPGCRIDRWTITGAPWPCPACGHSR